VLLPITVAGIYATVPDTEHVMIALGAALPLVANALPTPIATIGAEGAGASLAVVLWATAIDARGRPASLVGAVGCFGLLFAEPLGRRLSRQLPQEVRRRRSRRQQEHLQLVALFAGVQAGLAAYSARIVGTEHKAYIAFALLVPAAIAAVLVSMGLPPPQLARRDDPRAYRDRRRNA
jgi:hypothetical protein